MSQATLELILGELRSFRTEVNEEFQTVRTELKNEIQAVRTELKNEIQAVRTELKNEIQAVRTELKNEIQEVRTELKNEIKEVREEFHKEVQAIKKDQKTMLSRLNSQESMYAQLIGMVKSVKETVIRTEERMDEQERRFSFQFHTQSASIEVLHREQLQMKTDIEMLKNRY